MADRDVLKIWIDFMCPWARIGAHWILNVAEQGALDLDIEWKAFSLEQINLPEDASADELWASAADRRGLIPGAAGKWVATQAPETHTRFIRTMFDARHVDREKIGQPDVTAKVLDAVGLDGAATVKDIVDDPKWLEAARSDHEEAAELGIFGVPTFVFPGSQPVFIRLLEITEGARAAELYEKVRTGATEPLIHEMKRPSLFRK